MLQNIKLVLKFLLFCWFGFWVGITFLLIFPVIAIFLTRTEWYKHARFIRKYWLQLGLYCGWVRVECIYEEPLSDHPYVITPNHTSKLDMMVLTTKLDIDFNYAADKSFQKIPLFGLFFKTTDIPVDLRNPKGAASAFLQGVEQLREGISLTIFPEGQIARKTPKLSDFKDGAFKMAIQAKRPVLPVTFIHTWELLPDAGPLQFKPGKVIMYVHSQIPTAGMLPEQAPDLKQKVYDLTANKLKEYGYDPY